MLQVVSDAKATARLHMYALRISLQMVTKYVVDDNDVDNDSKYTS